MEPENAAPVSFLPGCPLPLPTLFKPSPHLLRPFPPLAALPPRRIRARDVALSPCRRRRAPVHRRRRPGVAFFGFAAPSPSPFTPVVAPASPSSAPAAFFVVAVDLGDHRGARAASHLPRRHGRPRACRVAATWGPAVSRTRPLVRLTCGAHGAGRCDPRCARSTVDHAAASEDPLFVEVEADVWETNSAKDEPLMAAATYFWSNTINAFLFNQGLMTPILIDITMIISLDVSSLANPMNLNTKNQYDFRTKSIVSKREFPVGKILLGYLYQLLNNASAMIAIDSVVGAGGPWWLLQSWLNLMVMKVVNRPSVTEAEFPRLELIIEDDGEEHTHRRCMSYEEYASTPADAGAKLSAELLKVWFCSFYEGFQKDARVWFPYEDSVHLDLPSDFRFEDINHEKFQKSREVFSAAISPCILPVSVHQRRNIQVSYEFYHPMSSARQLGMGQLPIGLFFANKIQCRGEISSTLMMDRLLNLQGPPLGNIENVELARFRSKNFDIWWGEWKLHLFHQPASMYMTDLFPDITPQTSTLLQGLIREPADAGKKRKTRASAVDTSAPAPKKKTKSKKTKPADDLPALDPSIEKALDEVEIGEDVDQAADEPPPPPSPVQQPSSDQTPSAVGSHHVEEEVQPAAPAIPVLADLFSFDIKDYFDETEEETTSKALAPLDDTVKKTLEDISLRLESSLDNLLKKAKQRIADRRERMNIEATIQSNRQLVHEEKAKLDHISVGPIQSNIDRLEARKIDLIAQCNILKIPNNKNH
uniref:Aminotransferase-like protein n=2 Tax=Oryza sativa subsp. japonica TaxID=39947 RepID=Q6ZHY4_ORYSJ|nr:aminotransferase-like protein [Oryza sativa Japonica Group]BAC92552.1 aminotransferase-like protein [Oryza sativa Japonica Group]